MFMLDAEGNVTVSYIQDGWFEAANFLKKLVDEGLLMKESFTYSNNDLLPTMHKDENVVGVTTNSSLAYVGSYGTENHDKYRLRYICIAPLTGPNGVQYTSYAQSATTQIWFVTADCENPELAFRVGDFQFTEEAFLFHGAGKGCLGTGTDPPNGLFVHLGRLLGMAAGDHMAPHQQFIDPIAHVGQGQNGQFAQLLLGQRAFEQVSDHGRDPLSVRRCRERYQVILSQFFRKR